MSAWIGRRLPRVEDERFLTGRGRYTDDVALDAQAQCAFLRSPHAHARIVRIDTTAAITAPGVLAVLTGDDWLADGLPGIDHAANPLDAIDVKKRAFIAGEDGRVIELPHFPLAVGRVRHAGEPIAVVVATSALAARDAAELIEIEYETMDAVVSPAAAALPDAPQVWGQIPGNCCFSLEYGDAAATVAALSAASHVVRHEFVNQRIANCQMEPRSALGDWDAASGTATLISGCQGVSRLQVVLAALFGLPTERVRVVCPDTGGGFGPRSLLYPEQAVVVWAAKRLGRPVKWTGDRSEGFLSDYGGRDSVIRAALAFDAEGRISAYDVEMFGNVGAHTVTFVPLANARSVLTTNYHVPAARLRSHGMVTHTVPTAPYRGAGRPEVTHALERLLDMAAGELGIDRIEIRRRNLVRPSQLPYRNPMGITYDSGDFPAYMDRVLSNADWGGFAQRREGAKVRGQLAGIGVSNYVECPVGAPRERAAVAVLGEGTVDVIVGTQSTGQGHETSFAQVVADKLGVPFESVRIRYGDTAFVKAGGGTHSDRSMRLAGALLVRATMDIVEKSREAAAVLLEAAAVDLVFVEGRYVVTGTDRSVSLFEIAKAVDSGELPAAMREALSGAGDYVGRIPAYPAGAAVCELEVDPATGTVFITRYTTVDDVGQPINPMIIDGQTHGGIAQGVGQALRESLCIDEAGQVSAGSFMDYGLSRADDLPSFSVELMEEPQITPDSRNPLRVKGGGEGGIVPATAAVVNALCNALGVRDLPMPATPDIIWRVLQQRL